MQKEPASTSEMVTQLLFGEHYSTLEQTDDWVKILTAYDKYECWINKAQHTIINEAAFKLLEIQKPVLTAELFQLIKNKNSGLSFPVSLGSTLPGYINKEFKLNDVIYSCDGKIFNSTSKNPIEQVVETAKLFLNVPYLWGGKTFMGIDCSGFTQMVYKVNGYKLPRDAYQQAELGHPLSFVEEAQAGDLAFFDNEEGKIIHVGIILNQQELIQAHGKVRIDKYDHYGIFNGDTKKYSHMLRVIKRMV